MTRRRFESKLVVITGGAGGLGRALGRAFGRRGAKVALLDLDGAAAEAAAATLRSDGIDARGFACDVTDERAVDRAFAELRSSLGAVDVVVANAGITHRSAFEKTAPAVIRRIMEVNFFGAVHSVRAALPDLIARQGMVIGISSVAGFAPLIARTGYAASKHALAGLLESLRSELAPRGVGVLLVYPSFIDTPIAHRALSGDGGQAAHAPAAVGRRTTPGEIAEKVVVAAEAGRPRLRPDRVSRIAWWFARLAPDRYARVMARRLSSELANL